MPWQVNDALKLINLFRDASILWDPKHPDFKNRAVRYEAIQKIADELNTTVTEVEKKIKGVKTQYSREHLRQLNGIKSTWFGYEPLSTFLVTEHKKYSHDSSANPVDDDIDFENISEIELVNEEDVSRSKDVFLSEENFRFINGEMITENWKKKVSDTTSNLYKRLKPNTSLESSYENYAPKDEISSFAECVIHKLRSIKSHRARSIAQYIINSVLFQAEMTNYYDDFEYKDSNIHFFQKIEKPEEKVLS